MQRNLLWLAATLYCAAFMSTSCGGNDSQISSELSNTGVEHGSESVMAFPPAASSGPKSASVADSGDYSLDLSQIHNGQSAQIDNDELLLAPASGTGFAVYRISEFDGDMYPLSALVNVASGDGSYSVGFADYDSGRWDFSGPYTGTSSIDLPSGGVNHPRRYVSDFGNCFMAIVAAGDESLRIDGIFLEVFGGNNAPLSPRQLEDHDDGDSLVLNWQASPSEAQPDFRGYVLERAPLLGGTYAEIASGWPAGNSFTDDSVLPLESYRYRLYAIDSAGNRSPYALEQSAVAGQGNPGVVAILELSGLSFEGPAEVSFDLSDSFGVNGAVIDTYELSIPGEPLLSGASSSFTLDLQPGCYRVIGRVRSGMITDDVVRYLRVYPRWQDDSVLVEELTGNMERNIEARSGMLPDGRIMHSVYDPAQHAISFWTENGDGLDFHTFWVSESDVTASCDPVVIGDLIYFGYRVNDKLSVFGSNGTETFRSLSNQPVSSDHFCLVENGDGRLAAFIELDNGGSLDMMYMELADPGNKLPVLTNITGGINGIDAVWNPTTSAFDICYGDNIALNYERWHPVDGHLAGSGLYNFKVLGVDLEIDPKTQRSVMLTTLDVAPFQAWYLQQEESGFWSLPEYPDENLKVSQYGDILATQDGTWILNFVEDGADDYLRMYSRNEGSWELYGEQLTMEAIEYTASLLPATGSVTACLPLKGGSLAVRSYVQGAAPTELYSIAGEQNGYGGELHATAGADGLHAVWKQRSNGDLVHVSSADGETWNDAASIGGDRTDIDLASTSEGEVYLSSVDVNSTELHYWDGSMWVQQLAYPGIAGYRPSLMSQPTNEMMYWNVHLQPANALRYVGGNQATPFTYNAVNPAEPTWQGTLLDGGFSLMGIKPRWFCMSGASFNSSELAFYDNGFSEPEKFQIQQSGITFPETYGRTMDSCLFSAQEGDYQCIWLVNASGFTDSILLRPNTQTNEFQQFYYPVSNGIEYTFTTGNRARSVNMAMGDGHTALVMEAGLAANENRLIWSNFGEFNELVLPDVLRNEKGYWPSSPEIVVGMDGRWHIIYLDLESNEMRCISTV